MMNEEVPELFHIYASISNIMSCVLATERRNKDLNLNSRTTEVMVTAKFNCFTDN